jgi:hypothetical protein
VTHANGTPAAIARLIITWACRGLVMNSTSSGMPAARHRPRSSAQDCGRYSSRSISACPYPEAYARNTPTWQFSVRPAVPEYCLCTPADRVHTVQLGRDEVHDHALNDLSQIT